MTPQQISHWIKQTRLKKGWTQTKLAELTQTTQPQIANFEANKVVPDYVTLKRVVEKLGGTIKVLDPIDQDEAIIHQLN